MVVFGRAIAKGAKMKNLISMLTAGAAALTVVGAANAADLPSKKAAPAQYVKICDAFGAGFFYIPGSDTCLKVGGQVRAEYTLRTNANAVAAAKSGSTPIYYNRDSAAFRARAYMNLDARTKTSYGDLQTFIEYRVTQDTTGAGTVGGQYGAFPGTSANWFYLTNAYIKFAGITAGRANSSFDFYGQGLEYLVASFVYNQPVNKLAYTASFGGGFSATISAEDKSDRVVSDTGADTTAYSTTKNAPIVYGGQKTPDFVANLRADQAWGSAQVAGALHTINAVNSYGTAFGANYATNYTGKNATGYAANAGLKINLPMLAAKDVLWLQASYSKGATDYTNPLDNYGSGVGSLYYKGTAVSVPSFDGFVRADGSLALTQQYSFFGGIQHNWTAEFKSSMFASYLNSKVSNVAYANSGNAANAAVYLVGANAIWSPVAGFEMGPEVVYVKAKLSGANAYTGAAGTTTQSALNGASDVRARFSIRRSF